MIDSLFDSLTDTLTDSEPDSLIGTLADADCLTVRLTDWFI